MEKQLFKRFFLTLFLLIITPIVNAKTDCGLVLTSRAFNTTDYSSSSTYFKNVVDNACKKTYTSKGAAENSGKAAAASVNYGAWGVGASQAKSKSSEQWSIEETDFCKDSYQKIKSTADTTLKTQVTNAAIKAWVECRKDENVLALTYTPSSDNTGFNGTLYRKTSGGQGKIIGIQVSDPDVKVSCKAGHLKLDSTAYDSSQEPPENKWVDIKKTETSITCVKQADKTVDVSILTTVNDIPHITLHSNKGKKVHELNKIESDLKAAMARLDEQAAAIKQLSIVQNTSIIATEKTSCPEGWNLYTKSQGKFLRGAVKNEKVGVASPSSIGAHDHHYSAPLKFSVSSNLDHQNSPSAGNFYENGETKIWLGKGIKYDNKNQQGLKYKSIWKSTKNNPTGEPRPANVSVNYCIKN